MIKDVLFVNPPGDKKLYRSIVCTFLSKANYIWQPQDFINLSATLDKNSRLTFIDCCQNGMGDSEVLAAISDLNPGLTVVSVSSISFDCDMNVVKSLRQQFPKMLLLVLGNVGLEKAFWPELLKWSDGIVINSFLANLRAISKENISSEGIVTTIKNDMPLKVKPRKIELGLPRHEIFVSSKYRFPFVRSFKYATVSTQFGCVYQCSYCSWSKIPVFYRDHEEIIRELKYLNKLGVRDIFFGDASFGFPKENAFKILDGMIANKFNMHSVCYINPIGVGLELLREMKKAGFHTLIIGIDDADLKLVSSKFQRNLTQAKLESFCEQAKSLDFEICGDFIIGLNTDRQSVDRNIRLACQLQLDYASFNILQPLFGSQLRQDWIAEGKIEALDIATDTSGKGASYNQDLIQIRNYAVKKFYLRPKYLFSRMVKVGFTQRLVIQLAEMIQLLVSSNLIPFFRKGS